MKVKFGVCPICLDEVEECDYCNGAGLMVTASAVQLRLFTREEFLNELMRRLAGLDNDRLVEVMGGVTKYGLWVAEGDLFAYTPPHMRDQEEYW